MLTRRIARPAFIAAALLALAGGVVAALPAAQAATGDGTPTDSNIAFVGRWDKSNASAYVPNWAGAYVRAGFTGTTVKLRQRNTIDLYYSIDGGAFAYIQNVSGTVNLTPTALRSGNHTLVVSYRVVGGSYNGDAVFQGLILDSGARTLAAQVSPRLIEFVGDSITLGSTSSKTALTAYGWLTGEQLGVEHTQLGYGGGCLVATSDGCASVASRFLKTGYSESSANWDFSRYQANAVVINLGTNDRSHGVTGPDFQNGYVNFLSTVRSKYPNAAILALETFSNRYSAETQAAVTARNNAGDRNVYFVDTTGWLPSDGLSDSVHPNDKGHQAIATRLAPIVSARIGTTPTVPPTTAPPTTRATTPPTTRATTVPPTTVPPTTRATTAPPTTTAPTNGPAGGCAAAYKITGQWAGGFQAEVTVTNTGTTATTGWAVNWTFPNGQVIGQIWGGVVGSPAPVTVTNVSWNGALAPNATTTFGFIASWNGTNAVPAPVTCARS